MGLKALYLLVLLSLLHRHQTQGCCLPLKWQVSSKAWSATAQPNGTFGIQSGTFEVFWDGIGEKVRLDMKPGPITTVLKLYKEKVAYTISNNTCTKWHPGTMKNKTICIPQHCPPSSPYTLGYKPSITVVDYSWDHTIVTMATGCVPIMTKQLISDKDVMQITYEDYIPTIRNASVFNVPAICKNATKVEYGMLSAWQKDLVWETFQ